MNDTYFSFSSYVHWNDTRKCLNDSCWAFNNVNQSPLKWLMYEYDRLCFDTLKRALPYWRWTLSETDVLFNCWLLIETIIFEERLRLLIARVAHWYFTVRTQAEIRIRISFRFGLCKTDIWVLAERQSLFITCVLLKLFIPTYFAFSRYLYSTETWCVKKCNSRHSFSSFSHLSRGRRMKATPEYLIKRPSVIEYTTQLFSPWLQKRDTYAAAFRHYSALISSEVDSLWSSDYNVNCLSFPCATYSLPFWILTLGRNTISLRHFNLASGLGVGIARTCFRRYMTVLFIAANDEADSYHQFRLIFPSVLTCPRSR